jgi:hypothetical protein
METVSAKFVGFYFLLHFSVVTFFCHNQFSRGILEIVQRLSSWLPTVETVGYSRSSLSGLSKFGSSATS